MCVFVLTRVAQILIALRLETLILQYLHALIYW